MSTVTPTRTPTRTPQVRPAAYSMGKEEAAPELEPATETFMVYVEQWRRLVTTLGTTLLKSKRTGS